MGTSRRWPGPTGGAWTSPHKRLRQAIRQAELAGGAAAGVTEPGHAGRPVVLSTTLSDADAEALADRYREALAQELVAEPEQFDLQPAMERAGGDLIGVLDDLERCGLEWF